MKSLFNLINEWKIFTRPYSSLKNKSIIFDLFQDKLNYKNVLNWSLKNTNKNFIFGLEQDYLAYRFEVLLDWINENEYYNEEYTFQLNKIIKILKLEPFLKAQEKAYVEHINAINFSKNRNLKSLIVDFDLKNNKEKAFFSFEEIDVYQINILTNEKTKITSNNVKMYITNQAIVIGDMLYHFRIQFDDSLAFKLTYKGILWNTKNVDYEFVCPDKYLLYTCLRVVVYDNLDVKNGWMWRKGIGIR